ncbi:arylamine N-acetyltransferase 2 [Fusarium albosuccineum]|uniref:Arylamine N-acetyltransferase 2 n=1 Tax=Fusarium albosuccineum TaxID=1237068 RepID=A0A8H4L7M2_9HYPO|nr:arylamine N-acetyltransferase 2 [Fusarium albosuccineum]
MADRIKYSNVQLQKYFDRIAFPSAYRTFSVADLGPDAQLQLLLRLLKYQLANVPFENLTLHYSWHRVIDVNVDHLYDKVVGERRGGYCMENNSFFHTVLLSLGYDVYMAGARVYSPDSSRYGGLSHCLNIVTIGAVRYGIDVGFGSRCPVAPLELIPGKIIPWSDMGYMRLRYDHIPQALSRKQKVWIYEFRQIGEADWVPQYCFLDAEFLPEDIRVMNWSPSTSPSSFFTFKILCVTFTTEKVNLTGDIEQDRKAIQDKEDNGDINGVLILDGATFKWRRKDGVRWERALKSDTERLEALQAYFGVELTEENKRAIEGTAGAIGP